MFHLGNLSVLRSAEGEFLTFSRTHREYAEDYGKLPEFLALSLLGAPRHTWRAEVCVPHSQLTGK